MSSGEEKIDKDVWGEYLKLGSPVPIVAIRILERYSLVSYNWDDWNDFYTDLKGQIIWMNNKYFQDNFLNPSKIIYKEAQLIETLRKSVEFYFFKGRRIYTASELNIIELISHCGSRGIMFGDMWEFYRKECMPVKFDDLTHFVK